MIDLIRRCPNPMCRAYNARANLNCIACGKKLPFGLLTILSCLYKDPKEYALRMFPDKPKGYIRQFVLIRFYLWTLITSKYGSMPFFLAVLKNTFDQMEDYAKEEIIKYEMKMNKNKRVTLDVVPKNVVSEIQSHPTELDDSWLSKECS